LNTKWPKSSSSSSISTPSHVVTSEIDPLKPRPGKPHDRYVVPSFNCWQRPPERTLDSQHRTTGRLCDGLACALVQTTSLPATSEFKTRFASSPHAQVPPGRSQVCGSSKPSIPWSRTLCPATTRSSPSHATAAPLKVCATATEESRAECTVIAMIRQTMKFWRLPNIVETP
jgi:hypothetical protein